MLGGWGGVLGRGGCFVRYLKEIFVERGVGEIGTCCVFGAQGGSVQRATQQNTKYIHKQLELLLLTDSSKNCWTPAFG